MLSSLSFSALHVGTCEPGQKNISKFNGVECVGVCTYPKYILTLPLYVFVGGFGGYFSVWLHKLFL